MSPLFWCWLTISGVSFVLWIYARIFAKQVDEALKLLSEIRTHQLDLVKRTRYAGVYGSFPRRFEHCGLENDGRGWDEDFIPPDPLPELQTLRRSSKS